MTEKNLVGANRVRLVDGYGKLERICVLKSHRSSGIGNLIMEALETEAKKQGASRFMLNAQTQAVPFTKNTATKSPPKNFLDADIPHVKMIKE
ncbi:GNAT family N-acetyltransferase [Bacillus sonorensis]|nr:GNAT family N-acetyltransferase [Bacillus sonorensis]